MNKQTNKQTRIFAAVLAAMLLALMMPLTVFGAETFEITDFDYGYTGPSDTPLLVILVNFDPSGDGKNGEAGECFLKQSNHNYWYNMLFGSGAKSMKSYFETQSGGNFRFIPAEETYVNYQKSNKLNDGIVEVTVNVSSTSKGSTSDPERYAALAAASEFVDWAVYDTNEDGRVTEDEMIVCFIAAGYEYTRNGSDTPSYNAHAGSFSYGFDGVSVVTDYIKVGEMIDETQAITVGSFCHELGHSLGNGDLYNTGTSWGGANSPAGKVSVMAGGGSAGANTGEYKGESPSNYDPYHLTVYGLYNYTNVGNGTYTLYSRQSDYGTYNILKISTPNPNVYYLIENRYFDNSSEHFDSETNYDGTRGIIIWYVDQTLADSGRAAAGMTINSGGKNADIGVAALAPRKEGGDLVFTANSGVFNQKGLVFNCRDYKFPSSGTWNTSLTEEEEALFNLQIEILSNPGHEMQIKVTGVYEAVSPRYTMAASTTKTTATVSGQIYDLNNQTLTSLTVLLSESEDFTDAKSVSLIPESDGTYSTEFTDLKVGAYYYTKVILGTKNGDFSDTEKIKTVGEKDENKFKISFFRGLTENDTAFTQNGTVGEEIVVRFPMKKTGYVFAGWYTDPQCTQYFDISKGKDTPGDISLYAKWIEEESAVELSVSGATVSGTIPYGKVGECFIEPIPEAMEGKIFVGWYADEALTIPYDFTAVIESTDDVMIWAKWEDEYVPVETTTVMQTTETTAQTTENTSLTESTGDTAGADGTDDDENSSVVIVVIVAVIAVAAIGACAFLVIKKKK